MSSSASCSAGKRPTRNICVRIMMRTCQRAPDLAPGMPVRTNPGIHGVGSAFGWHWWAGLSVATPQTLSFCGSSAPFEATDDRNVRSAAIGR